MLKTAALALALLCLSTSQAQAQLDSADAFPLELSLQGGVYQDPEHTEYRALALLEVPLERVVQVSQESSSSHPKPATAGDPVPGPATDAGKPPAVAPTATPRAPEPSRSWLQLAERTVALGLLAQGYSDGQARLESMSERSRSSAWLPEVRFRAQTSQDQALRLTPTDTDPYRYTQSGQNAVLFEGAATFRLHRLIFADQELAIERARLEREKERLEFSQLIIKLVFDWKRARTLSALASASDDEAALEALKALEFEARLDALTAGWFSRNWSKFDGDTAPAARTHPPPR